MNYWLSWYHEERFGEFELHWPWWVSGWRCSDDAATICAAVRARDGEAAQRICRDAYDARPREMEWRFVTEKPPGWSPYGSRFGKGAWMRLKWAPCSPRLAAAVTLAILVLAAWFASS
jgi:hypothetical protein